MIDLTNEEVISLNNATAHLPRRRSGKRPHVSTLFRWAQRGCRGVKLEVIRVGGTLCTSVESLQRFCDQLTHPHAPPAGSQPTPERAAEDAERELRDLGF